ncbi:MAG: aminotransferase class V-fold PLP-dependent enzyme, partial [Anaerolineae bacterium]
PIINAAGTITTYGGSLMPPEVVEAMAAASRAFVDMHELHLAAGKRIAELVGVEAAHVCACAAAGITVMAAACMAGTDPARIAQLPDTTGMRHKFIVQRSHRNPFDQALRLSGGEFVQIEADATALAAALGTDVAAVYYTFAWFCTGPALPLPQVAEMAHAVGVPVIVDAAAEVPPLGNLRRFLDEGADLVTFSGGKAIRGPQSSGLILGRADLIEACRRNDSPNMSVGRPMKASKEDIAGLVKAVELYVKKDHAAEMALWERRVACILQALSGLEHVRAWRQFPYGVGQQIPHLAISWDEQALGITYPQLLRQLRQGRPAIVVQLYSPDNYTWSGVKRAEVRVHPHTLQDGEETVLARRLREVLTGAS